MDILIIIGIVIFAIYLFKVFGKSKAEIERQGNPLYMGIKNSEEFVTANINKARKYAQKSITKSYLTGCTWVLVNNGDDEDILFTFRTNNELLITTNGIVDKGEYELIIDNNSILLTRKNITEHYNIANVQDDFMFLNKMSSEKVLVFANQTKFKDEVKYFLNKQAKELYDFEEIQY